MNRRQGANAQNHPGQIRPLSIKTTGNQYFISDVTTDYPPRKIIRRQIGECPEPIPGQIRPLSIKTTWQSIFYIRHHDGLSAKKNDPPPSGRMPQTILVKFVRCPSKIPGNQYFISDITTGYPPRKMNRRQVGECPKPVAMAKPKKCQPKIEYDPLHQAKAHLYVAKPELRKSHRGQANEPILPTALRAFPMPNKGWDVPGAGPNFLLFFALLLHRTLALLTWPRLVGHEK